jgi:hypothetical protein
MGARRNRVAVPALQAGNRFLGTFKGLKISSLDAEKFDLPRCIQILFNTVSYEYPSGLTVGIHAFFVCLNSVQLPLSSLNGRLGSLTRQHK